MKTLLLGLCFASFILSPSFLSAQQHVAVMSRCGGVDTVVIPNIIDNDHDGMDDRLEQKLLNKFMPVVIMFSDESCPGPALDGTGDTNLIVERISPYPGQYTRSSSLDSVLIHPVPVVAAKHLYAGLIWYNPFIMVHCVVLYGQDCGALGHTADVEGFHFSLKYIGPDTLAGWMYDTIMTNWMGVTIQSISHDATLCQHIETRPYKSALFPTGVDTVYASPDKHGNYLTIGDCNGSFICNPGCNNTQIRKHTVNVNIGEPTASLVPDLGAYYPAYIGNDPWSTSNFLSSQGGNAGTIAAKMERALSSDFAVGQTLTTPQICPIYLNCYGPSGSVHNAYTCTPATYNFFGQHLSAPGLYTHTVTNSYGCDSTISLTLAVYSPTAYSFNDYTCQGVPYSFRGQQLTVAGVYHDTTSNANGCDSAITLILSVVPPTAYTLQDSFCTGSSYSFNGRQLTAAGQYQDTLVNTGGCVSFVTLNLSSFTPPLAHVNAATCAGSSYNFGGQQLTAPGVYTDTLSSVHGCDSIVTLSLVIDSLPAVSWNSNTDTLALNGSAISLSGATPAGGTYTGAGVSGNYFFPDSAGAGTHVISYVYTDSSGCSNVAEKAFVVVVAGINDIELAANIQLYPNPANDKLVLQSDLFSTHEVNPVIYDVTGKSVITSFQKQGNNIMFNINKLADGMYWVRFNIHGTSVSKKFVKGE